MAFRYVQIGAFAVLSILITGCSGLGLPQAETYDLAAIEMPEKASGRISRQLLVTPAGASEHLASNKILVRENGNRLASLQKAQWSGDLPALIQVRLIEALENSGRVQAVGRPGEGLSIDYQLLVSLRAFELDTTQEYLVRVGVFAKVLDENSGAVIASRRFERQVPVASDAPQVVANSLNTAFSALGQELVAWVIRVTP